MHAHPTLTADDASTADGGADAVAVAVVAQWLLLLLLPHVHMPSLCCCCTYTPSLSLAPQFACAHPVLASFLFVAPHL
jgi:hypothetical protein